MHWSRFLQTVVLLPFTGALFGACANSNAPDLGEDPGSDPQNGGELACILHNCQSDAECGACSGGRHTCELAQHRCVACDAMTGNGCPQGETCSSYGNCVPAGLTCTTDAHGVPQITCSSSADCAACDPMHQVCDTATGACVACTSQDTSACMSTDICVNDRCDAKCPGSCTSDNDCGQCGAPGHEAHACTAHHCAECSATYACPSGKTCSPQGVCVTKCGSNGAGVCDSDADCSACGGSATTCHKPLNGPGKCGPSAAGCSDLGNGVAVLPDPWSQVTNLCSNDGDCSGVGIDYNVGKMLRDLTGIQEIHDADLRYGMNVCANVTVGIGGKDISCGVCVPCRVDTDCKDIAVDDIAGQALGNIGKVATDLLMDQIFGPNDHTIHMYCEPVAGGYGVCAPCPGLLTSCGIGKQDTQNGEGGGGAGGGGNGGTGTCDHDACTSGSALDASCDTCAASVCPIDGYCCSTTWDATCIDEANQYCNSQCAQGGTGGGGGGNNCHDECTPGAGMDAACTGCTQSVCANDAYCCSTSWDATCVKEADQYCNNLCGGGGGGGGCASASDCSFPDGCRADGTCGVCFEDADCSPNFCDINSGQCY
jgi:hypothetical protein